MGNSGGMYASCPAVLFAGAYNCARFYNPSGAARHLPLHRGGEGKRNRRTVCLMPP